MLNTLTTSEYEEDLRMKQVLHPRLHLTEQ